MFFCFAWGHFVPEWRKESSCSETSICDQHILDFLEKMKVLAYMPSRKINSGWIVCYDDCYNLCDAHHKIHAHMFVWGRD